MLEIIYQDDDLIVINKPHGLLVHQSSIARDAEEFALQMLRDQIGQNVWPAHRLDRKTSGLLLFALNTQTNSLLQALFRENLINKKYLELGKNAKEFAKQFYWKEIIKKYADLLNL